MVKATAIIALLFIVGSAHADDAKARKVRVALALCKDGDCPKKKVSDALKLAAPKSKEVKVQEALMPISTAPMPREKAACPCSLGCDCNGGGNCNCKAHCSCPDCPAVPSGYTAAYARVLKGERVTFEVKTRVGSWDAGVWECVLENGEPVCRLKPVVPVVPVRIAPSYPAYPFSAPLCLPGGR